MEMILADLIGQIANAGGRLSTNGSKFGIEIVESQVVDGEYMEVPLTNDNLSKKEAVAFLQGYLACKRAM